ncbi:hypothetical protein C3F00_036640, partial [Pseudomonas sp. MWU13-2860]
MAVKVGQKTAMAVIQRGHAVKGMAVDQQEREQVVDYSELQHQADVQADQIAQLALARPAQDMAYGAVDRQKEQGPGQPLFALARQQCMQIRPMPQPGQQHRADQRQRGAGM